MILLDEFGESGDKGGGSERQMTSGMSRECVPQDVGGVPGALALQEIIYFPLRIRTSLDASGVLLLQLQGLTPGQQESFL
jgi:hypothetical protein